MKKKSEYWSNKERFRDYSHEIVHFFSLQRIKEIRNNINIEEQYKLLDIGAGNGFSSFYFKENFDIDIYVGDYSDAMLIRNPLRKKIIFDAKKLPFKDNSFEVVNIWEVLHHIKEPIIALKEAYRVSKKYLILFEPNRNNPFQFLFALFDKEHRLVMKYNMDYLKKMVKDAGFKIRISKKVGFLFPNLTPFFIFKIIKKLPFTFFLGISIMIIGEK